jgi:hypothetical protein
MTNSTSTLRLAQMLELCVGSVAMRFAATWPLAIGRRCTIHVSTQSSCMALDRLTEPGLIG